jgi:hypothetical protein
VTKPLKSSIEISNDAICRKLTNGSEEKVAWEDLQEVSVMTTDQGPFADDVYFVLLGASGSGCVIPQSTPESGAVLERLQQLPGFDNEAFIRALGSTENATFTCWKRK